MGRAPARIAAVSVALCAAHGRSYPGTRARCRAEATPKRAAGRGRRHHLLARAQAVGGRYTAGVCALGVVVIEERADDGAAAAPVGVMQVPS